MSTIGYLVFLISLLNCQSREFDIGYFLYTRANRVHQSLHIDDKQSLQDSYYNGSLRTIISIHGYLDNIKYTTWTRRLTNELLRYGDYNVISVDWSNYNRYFYYEVIHQVPAIGAEIAKFIRFLQNSTEADVEKFYIIGHSLGAQVAGHVGKNIPNIGRITGLDPAGPGFQKVHPSKRLDKSDAQFVDIIHTDSANDVGYGFGTNEVIGLMDFFPNGGNGQPGCAKDVLLSFLRDGIFKGLSHFVACDHSRVLDLFIYSINNKDCLPVGIECRSWRSFRKGRCGDCGNNGSRCAKMGFHADKNKAAWKEGEHVFYLRTPSYAPYCYHLYQIKVELAQPDNGSVGISGMYVVLHGLKERMRLTLTEGFDTLYGNGPYPYLVTMEHELGEITKVDFRWVDDSHYDYLSHLHNRSDSSSSKFYLRKIRISPIKLTQSVRYFCGIPGVPLVSNVVVTLTASSSC